jgi:hypothetical protein
MNDPRGHRALPYHPDAYDEHFALRVPPLLWLVLAFAVHPQVLLLLSHLPQGGGEFAYLAGLVDVPALVATVPAIAVLAAAARRRPAAGSAVRWLWRRGAWLLLVSLLANFTLCLNNPHSLWSGLRMAADLAAVGVLVGVARVRDTFADFPVLPV